MLFVSFNHQVVIRTGLQMPITGTPTLVSKVALYLGSKVALSSKVALYYPNLTTLLPKFDTRPKSYLEASRSNHSCSPQLAQPRLATWEWGTFPCTVWTPLAALFAACPSDHRCHFRLLPSSPFLHSVKYWCHFGLRPSGPSLKSANRRSLFGLRLPSLRPPILPPRIASRTRSTLSLSVSQRERHPSTPCSRCGTSGGRPAQKHSRQTRPKILSSL